MTEAVGSGIRGRVVESDRAGFEPLDRLEQVRGQARVVADDLAVGAEVAEVRRVETAHDGDPVAVRRDEERALPGAVRARYQIEARIRS